MAAFRASGTRGLGEELLNPGDAELISAVPGVNTTNGASTLTAASIVTSVIFRSGSGAGYTDTFDTAANIYAALIGNGNAPAIVPGLGFPLRIVNTVAFLETLTLGAGMVAGNGTIATVSASGWRDFWLTFLSAQPPITVVGNNTNGSAVVTFTLAAGQTALAMGPSLTAINIMVGATATGTGIPANTTVLGITQAPGGIIGVTLSANCTSTNTNINISFGSTIQIHGLGAGTL